MNTFETFNKKFFYNPIENPSGFNKLLKKATWLDESVYIPLGTGLTAKISISDNGYQNHYTSYLVQIINKTEGVVDAKRFDFKNYITFHSSGNYSYAWYDRDNLSWYCCTPNNRENLTTAIYNYLLIYIHL